MKKYLLMIGNVILYLGILFLFVKLLEQLQSQEYFFNMFMNNPSLNLIVINALPIPIYFILTKWKRQSFLQACQCNKISFSNMGYLILAGISMTIFSISLVHIDFVQQRFPEFLNMLTFFHNGKSFLLLILCVTIIGPVFEEILFRGFIFNEFKKCLPIGIAIFLQAALYAYFMGELPVQLYSVISGVLFGLICYWYKSIVASITVQIANTMSMFTLLELGAGSMLGGLSTGTLVTILIVDGLLLGCIIIFLYRRSIKDINLKGAVMS